MATQRCPICGVSVKSENLARHLEAQHPRDAKATAAREKIRRQPAPRAAKPAGRRIRLGRFHYLAIAVVVLVILAIYLIPRASVSQFDVVNSCGAEGFAEHYHPLLIINDHGTHQHLPYDSSQGADIGYVNRPGFTNKDLYCSYGQLHAMHTHDGSGIIHIEGPDPNRQYTLGDFFAVWYATYPTIEIAGKVFPVDFSAGEVLGHKADAAHHVRLLVDGIYKSEPAVFTGTELEVQLIAIF